jgi:transposase InsO family protein
VWLTDITEHRTDEGKLYLCAIKDVYSNRIVGYSTDSRMKASLAVAALDHAIVFAQESSFTRCRTAGYVDRCAASVRATTRH